jgi:hypothetical protein
MMAPGHPICQNDKTIQDIRSKHDETFTLFDTSGVPRSIWVSIWYVMGANTNGVPYNVQTNMSLSPESGESSVQQCET